MNTLNITTNGLFKGCRLYADGKQIALKRGANGVYTGVYRTENDEAEIAVIKPCELNGAFWFLWAMLFFIISCFGIFNSRYDKRCTTVNYQTVVKLKEVSNLRLEANKFVEGQRAVSFACDCPVSEKINVYGVDGAAKKKFKLLTLAEVLLLLALIAVIIAVVITKLM